jgi:EAL domain-containing protein (putative c-di-GMP-specific phosphodiesterase class I)
LHRDGHQVPVEISVSRFDSDGEMLIGAFMRDLSDQRAAEAHLDREIQERGKVARSVAQIRPGQTAEQTAAAICRSIGESLNLEVAAVYHIASANQAIPLGVRAPRGAPIGRNRPLPPVRAAHLIRQAKSGPWVERWDARPEDGAYARRWTGVGLSAAAYVPFRGTEGLLGLLVAGTTVPSPGADDMARRLPSLLEYASLAGALLGPQLTGRRVRQAKAERIRRIIDRQAFHAVFQPIVRLDSGAVVGYEALTRFDDDVRPDIRLADADAAGLGLELEISTMAAALKAAVRLPEGPWISLNASPRLVLDGDSLRDMLQDVPRGLVIEITEQSPIADYGSVRQAIAAIGKQARLAVDDAGAGFASLRHIIELRPNLVKLDVGLIQGIQGDSARQALVAGMVHFAQRAGCELIAEGIEEEADLRTLRGLGIRLGQGYLLGRPALPGSFPDPGPSMPRPPEPTGVWNWSPVEALDPHPPPFKH